MINHTREPHGPAYVYTSDRTEAEKIRRQFRLLSEQFDSRIESYISGKPFSGDILQCATANELSSMFSTEKGSFESRPRLRVTLHDFRSRIAVINNAVLLLGLVSAEAERRNMADIVHRNLAGLTIFVDHICDDIEHGAEDPKMAVLLTKASEKLARLLNISIAFEES